MSITRAFSAINLTCNPFGEPDLDDWPTLAVSAFDLELAARRLSSPGFALQLRGEAGRGKSTHLRALHARLDVPLTYLPEDGPLPRIPRAAVVLVDECQRLPWWRRALLFRRAASFAIATHADLEPELRAAGLSVETVDVGAESERRLRAIVERRLRWARRGPGAVPSPSDAFLEGLVEAHGDDLRAIMDALYDVYQEREGGWRGEV